jgi:hypothetical protein
MRSVTRRALAAFVAVLVSIAAVPARAEYADLVKSAPAGANAIVLIDVEKLLASPLGVKEGWREKHDQAFRSGLVIVPPKTKRFVMSAQFDFQFMHPVWQNTLLDLDFDLDLGKAAAAYGATVDKIGGFGGYDAAVFPGDLYVVRVSPRTAAVIMPANRQNVGRWLAEVNADRQHPLSPYLAEAVAFAESGAPLIMALDLEHVFPPEYIRQRLESFEALKDKNVDLDALSKQLASIRGVSLGVTVAESRFGKIKVDFNEPIALQPELAKAVLLEVLGNRGAMIHEFAEWPVKIEGTRVSIEGTLEDSGMRRILSVIDAPPALHNAMRYSEVAGSPSEKQTVADTSKRYYQAVATYIDDLRVQPSKNTGGTTTTGLVAMWYDRYARKIDSLSVLHVDNDLVQYGAFVSHSMRSASEALKNVGAQSTLRAQDVPTYYNVRTWAEPIGVTRWGAYGAYGWSATPDDRRRAQEQAKVRTEERIRGYTAANLIMQGVDEATADVRRRMTQKYQSDF